jgi:hypothetical protein
MMPIMFTFFSLSFPSGLALYWVISNIFSIVVQYYVTGWGSLNLDFFTKKPSGGGSSSNKKLQKRLSLEESSSKEEKDEKDNSNKDTQKDTTQKEGLNDGDSGSKREDSGGSDKKGFGSIKSWFK